MWVWRFKALFCFGKFTMVLISKTFTIFINRWQVVHIVKTDFLSDRSNNNGAEIIFVQIESHWISFVKYHFFSKYFLRRFNLKPLAFIPNYKLIKKTHIDEYDDKQSQHGAIGSYSSKGPTNWSTTSCIRTLISTSPITNLYVHCFK